jgi:hypothetical protein
MNLTANEVAAGEWRGWLQVSRICEVDLDLGSKADSPPEINRMSAHGGA